MLLLLLHFLHFKLCSFCLWGRKNIFALGRRVSLRAFILDHAMSALITS